MWSTAASVRSPKGNSAETMTAPMRKNPTTMRARPSRWGGCPVSPFRRRNSTSEASSHRITTPKTIAAMTKIVL